MAGFRRRRLTFAFDKMKGVRAIEHRGLLYVLFTLFELLFVAAIVLMFSLDPRRYFVATDAIGITWLFSLVGLLAVSWFVRGTNPPLARLGSLTVLAGFLSSVFLSAIP